MNKYVYILHSVSGGGKSTLAEAITEKGGVICCADDGHLIDGKYVFDACRLNHCHRLCEEKFTNALTNGESPVVVANTNTKTSEWKFYDDIAKEKGYIVFHLVVENRHGNRNIHNVSETILKKQEHNIRSNLKLI